jgi:hypothetical protein
MFRSTTIIRELLQILAKVIFILKYSVKLRRYMFFGDVAACHRAECVLCAVQNDFSQVQCKLSDDGRRPNHVGAIFCVYFNVNFKPFQVS